MKTSFIHIILFACFVACGSSISRSDNNETSKPLPDQLIGERDTTIDFESNELAKNANGFSETFTDREQRIKWEIVNDNGNKVVAQLAKNNGDRYNLNILEKPGYRNLSISVKAKAVSGNEDQGGGLVWRYIDNNNYYVARYNPLENNFRLYRVVNGSRRQLKSEASNVQSNVWFSIKIEMKGSKILCFLNGEKITGTEDDTFPKAGRVGLWTKADAITYFDDLIISVLN